MLAATFRIALSGAALIVSALALAAAEPIRIVSHATIPGARQPQAAIDEEGVIYVTLGAGDSIYACRSADGGKSYGAPVHVGNLPKLALGMRRGPRIVATNKLVVITAISHEDGNLAAWRSSDGGLTWSDPNFVNDSLGNAREGLHAMALGPDAQVFCAWLDLRYDGTQIFASQSVDGGRTWSKNRRIYASPSGTVCECCHPSVAIDDRGVIYTMWRNALQGDRDMFIAKSDDTGETFGAAAKLGNGSWKLDACPMDGGFLAVTPSRQVTTIWRRQNDIFLSRLDGRPEQRLGTGQQPWAAANADGIFYVWLNRRPGDLWLLTPGAQRPTKLASDATDPVIAAPRSGRGPVVAVWETGRKPNTSIMAAVIVQ